jgi:UDP-N-acetylmuramoylalanine--D-glutamate ligase
MVGGVVFINDSKATNPHAVISAVGEYGSVVLLAGGRNKGLDLAPIGEVEGVRHLVAFGESAPDLVAVARMPATQAADLAAAFAAAVEIAEPGDTVLLSPGCASFDEFASYEHRGDAFRALVRAHGEAA